MSRFLTMPRIPETEPDDRDPLSTLEVRCEPCGYLWPVGTPVQELDYEYFDHIGSDLHRNAVEQRRAERRLRVRP